MKYKCFVGIVLSILFSTCALADEWRTEAIDGSMQNGLCNAMVRDTFGYLHVVTYDNQEQTFEYLYEDNEGWHVDVIESVYFYYTGTSIAVDADGRPHISYYDSENDRIRYAHKNQNGWIRRTVVAPVASVNNTEIALDSSGTPWVFYDNAYADIIKCAQWNGTQWVIENAGSGFSPWGHPARFSVAIDDTDTIHLSYIRYNATDLVYRYRDGSGWQEEIVDNYMIRGDYTSIVIDNQGNPHIAYTTDTENNDRYNVNLKYAVKNGGNWQKSIIDDDGEVGDFVTLSLTQNGRPVMSYYDLDNESLKFAAYNGTAWQKEYIDTDPAVGEYACMILDGNDKAVVAYRDEVNDDLKIATETASGWTYERPVTTGKKGLYKWIAVDADNYPHIAYSGGGSEGLKYAWMDGNGWNIEIADSTGKSGFRAVLDLDAAGYPHIIHGEPDAMMIKYTWNDGSAWHTVAVADYISYRDEWGFCLGPDDQPHICHIDPDNDTLLYTTRNGQNWQTETAMAESVYGEDFIMMMGSNGNPCIAMTHDSEIKVVRRAGGSWSVESVCSYSSLNGPISAVMDSNDRVHLVYHNGDTIKYMHRDDGEWEIEVVDNVGSFIWGGTTVIDLDAAGSPRILYDDQDSARIVIYSKDDDEWADEKCIEDGSIAHGCLVMDGNDIPHICYYDGYLSYTANVPEITDVRIEMPDTHFRPGSTFACSAVVSNDRFQPLDQYPLFVLLEAYGMFFFAPSFNAEFDCYLTQYPTFHTGRTTVPVLPEFEWPAAGSGGATWYAALTDPSMTALYGEMDMAGFSWSE